MRPSFRVRCCLLSCLIVFSTNVYGQVYMTPSSPPAPDAAVAANTLLSSGQPIYFAGSVYYRTGPTVFFNGNEMVRVGSYEGIPLYIDTSIEPYSIVFVPAASNLMRPYEKRREGELAGTVGSRVSSFPIQRDTERALGGGARAAAPYAVPPVPLTATETPEPVGTSGNVVPAPVLPPIARVEPTIMQSIPGPQSSVGVWIEFESVRFYPAGGAVVFSPDRFVPIGEYHGFPVYRDRNGREGEIYIPAYRDGALTPYRR